jgi:outer membrane protein OmpA-like peptidoglycan-associated protein
MKRISTILTFFLLATTQTLAQKVTVSNNLLYDATLTPNLRLGVRLSPHWSMGVTGGYRPWPTSDEKTTKWKHLLVSPDIRYWTDSVNVHHFFGINPVYAHYNISGIKLPFNLYQLNKEKRYQGDFGGLGVFYGYSWPLGRHWNIEALIGGIVGYAKYDTYECGHCGKKVGNDKKIMVLPQAALNIVYNIPGRKRPVAEPVEPVVPAVIPSVVPADTMVTHQSVVKVEQPIVDKTAHIKQLAQETSMVAHISDYEPFDPKRSYRREGNVLYVYYPVAKFVVREDFKDNAPTLRRIIDVTREVSEDTACSVKKIQIVGFASVEGGQWGNERLALRRANALKQYVQKRLNIPDSLFEVVSGGEAWPDLRDYVEELMAGKAKVKPVPVAKPTKADLQKVLDIIDKERDATRREQRLRALNGGRTWRYIRQVFSDHRNASYVRVYYDFQ